MSTGDVKTHLGLLDEKEKEPQQAGVLGKRIPSQQIELDERVRQLRDPEAQPGDNQNLDSEIRERDEELTETVKIRDTDNPQLTRSLDSKSAINSAPSQASPRADDIPRDSQGSKVVPPLATTQSRHAKNAAQRAANDVEFAFEIGSGLLGEVRRLQGLLGERDKVIQDMKEEKDDLVKTTESLRSALRIQEQSADKFKEESRNLETTLQMRAKAVREIRDNLGRNLESLQSEPQTQERSADKHKEGDWNLEVTLQELRAQLSDSQASTKRLECDHERLTNLLAAAREDANRTKTENERLKTAFDEFKAKHETYSVCRTAMGVPPAYTSEPVQKPTKLEKKPSRLVMLWECVCSSY